ncbi:MAG: Hpt domain-containing protein [Spirochaetales bacterium]|jgi:two-component system chemotaxis sensor kinase CheA|nr:Hpt domain-containing protein [Spirochaetales bacterium]
MNAATARELKLFFRDDAQRIGESLSFFVKTWMSGGDTDLVSRCFRDVHSLKSEAAFLGYGAIAAKAEAIEKVLATARDSGNLSGGQEFSLQVENLCGELRQTLEDLNAELGEPGQEDPSRRQEAAQFSSDDFEMAMIQEARCRGERFFRIDVEIGPDEPMPFPRLYLLVNNLELCANVIRITPPLDILKQDRDFAVSLYATTGKESSELEKALDVDGVVSLDIAEIPFGHVGQARKEESAAEEEFSPASAIPRYARGERKSVFLYQDDLARNAFLAACLGVCPVKDARGKFLARELASALIRQNGTSIALILEKAAEMANDTASALGKMLETKVRMDGDVFVPPAVRDALNTILTHLVRNAVDHGIEKPRARQNTGKPEWGNLLIETVIKNGDYSLKVADDGAGISVDKIRAALGPSAYASEKQDGILEILTRPGFTTRRISGAVSGRGVGLDTVRGLVTGVLGGGLSLKSKPGQGTAFLISFSDRTVKHPAFSAQIGGRMLLAPKVMTERIFPLTEKISGKKKLSYTLDGVEYPLRLLRGQASPGTNGILIRAGGQTFIIAADSIEDEKLYSPAELVSSVCVLMSHDS